MRMFQPSRLIAAPAAAVLMAALLIAASHARTAIVPGAIERLKPGASLWAPNIAPEGPVTIVVSIPLQRALVYRNGIPIGVTTVSTGRSGHETPTGVFTILEKQVDHKSSLYDDAPMPFMQRLTWDGVALHAGDLPGYPASHGCIRLPRDFARRLYAITRRGAVVIITDESVQPEVSPAATPALARAAAATIDAQEFEWLPEASLSGPVSIMVSGGDRRLLVLRNGVLIGSAPLQLDEPIAVTSAFILRSIDAAGEHWFEIGLPGQRAPQTDELSVDQKQKGRLPEAFIPLLASVLRPGVTMLVTRDTLAASGVGRTLRVMESRADR